MHDRLPAQRQEHHLARPTAGSSQSRRGIPPCPPMHRARSGYRSWRCRDGRETSGDRPAAAHHHPAPLRARDRTHGGTRMIDFAVPADVTALAEEIRGFVIDEVIPYETDPRLTQ